MGCSLGKAELRVSCVCITVWLVCCDFRLVNFLHLRFLPHQFGMEILTSQVAVRMRIHVVKASQEMGTCLLHCCSLGVRDYAKQCMALSHCIIVIL